MPQFFYSIVISSSISTIILKSGIECTEFLPCSSTKPRTILKIFFVCITSLYDFRGVGTHLYIAVYLSILPKQLGSRKPPIGYIAQLNLPSTQTGRNLEHFGNSYQLITRKTSWFRKAVERFASITKARRYGTHLCQSNSCRWCKSNSGNSYRVIYRKIDSTRRPYPCIANTKGSSIYPYLGRSYCGNPLYGYHWRCYPIGVRVFFVICFAGYFCLYLIGKVCSSYSSGGCFGKLTLNSKYHFGILGTYQRKYRRTHRATRYECHRRRICPFSC